jgi:hypothetical protein
MWYPGTGDTALPNESDAFPPAVQIDALKGINVTHE